MNGSPNNSNMLKGFKMRLQACIEDLFDGKHTRLARKSGIAPSTIQGWIDKDKVNPNSLALLKVARACNTTVEWLLTGEGPEAGEGPERLRIPHLGETEVSPEEWDLIGRMLEVIRTKGLEGKYDEALRSNVLAFHRSVIDAKKAKKNTKAEPRGVAVIAKTKPAHDMSES